MKVYVTDKTGGNINCQPLVESRITNSLVWLRCTYVIYVCITFLFQTTALLVTVPVLQLSQLKNRFPPSASWYLDCGAIVLVNTSFWGFYFELKFAQIWLMRIHVHICTNMDSYLHNIWFILWHIGLLEADEDKIRKIRPKGTLVTILYVPREPICPKGGFEHRSSPLGKTCATTNY